MVLARNLNTNSIISWSREEEVAEILGASVYTPLAALYGKIGATTVERRDGQHLFRTICLDNI